MGGECVGREWWQTVCCRSQRNVAFRSAGVSKTHDASLIAEMGIWNGSPLLSRLAPALACVRQ